MTNRPEPQLVLAVAAAGRGSTGHADAARADRRIYGQLPGDGCGRAPGEAGDAPGCLLHSTPLWGTITDMGWAFVLAAVFFGSTVRTHDAGTGAVITAAVGFVLWLVSVWLTPFRRCRTCRGTGRQTGLMSTWGHRQCPSCGGAGRHRRYNVTTFFGNNLTRGEARAFRARSRRARPRP